jgi:hypothetical protein
MPTNLLDHSGKEQGKGLGRKFGAFFFSGAEPVIDATRQLARQLVQVRITQAEVEPLGRRDQRKTVAQAQ